MLKKIGAILGICIAAVVALILFGMILSRPVSKQKLEELGVIGADSRYVDVDGVSTRYVDMGEGEQAIVFIHGFSSSLYTWRACLAPLSEDYRVLALDLKGFGYSGKPPSDYTIADYVEFVVHFMDALSVDKATLCGNSMGGNIAWRTALAHPERVDKLILVDASGYPSEHKGIPLFLRLGRLPGVGKALGLFLTKGRIRESLESAYYDDNLVTDETVGVYYYATRTEGGIRAPLARLRSSGEDVEQWAKRIPEIAVPTLIVWGAEDTWIEKENAVHFHRDIANSGLVIVPACGHLPQEEAPGEFIGAVTDFMSGNERTGMLTNVGMPVADEGALLQPAA
jgi:pimeloyl-ACP methyl ester carboxylesterase